jgi:sulfate permease, SulP family
MAGAGVLIALGQIGNFVGAAKKGSGDQSVITQTWETLAYGWPFNPYSIGLGAGTIVLVLVLRRLIDRYKLPRIDMLVGLILASLVAAHFGWSLPAADGKSIVSTVGTVPAALPGFYVPEFNFDSVSRLLPGALAISFLGLLEALAVAKSIAAYTRQPLDYNRQCLAEGVGNLVGGFFQSLPGSGSLTRSAINYQSGAITRASGVYSGIIVAVVVLLGGPYARFIPKSALAGLLFITAARLIDWKRLAFAIRASWFDAALVAATGLSAIFISVDASILVGVALSIIMFVPRASKPGIRELIVAPDRVIRERRPGEERAKWLLIYDLEGELFFGSSPEVERHLTEIIAETDRTGIRYVVLRLRRSRHPDVVAVEHLVHFLRDAEKRGVTVLLAGLRSDFVQILDNVHLTNWFPADRIFPDEGEAFSATLNAVRHAGELARATERAEPEGPGATRSGEREPAYYLV